MIRVGTCSWTEKTLVQSGGFYPKTARTAESRLLYYADHFDTVEVDSTYYALPTRQTAYLWADRTADNFIFHIKVFGGLTGHGVNPAVLPADLRDMLNKQDKQSKVIYIKEHSVLRAVAQSFRDALYPLMSKCKLGILLFQFPQWFRYSRSNMDYILLCKDLMAGHRIAVEFRHGSWLAAQTQDSVFHLLRKHQITYVAADEPQYGSLATVPFLTGVTTDTAYFRFHGRNKENWLKRGIDTSLRYSYLYSDEELEQFKSIIESVDKRASVTYAMFNNCHGDFAVRNAIKLKENLTSEGNSSN